jgi:hypothetical protein
MENFPENFPRFNFSGKLDNPCQQQTVKALKDAT